LMWLWCKRSSERIQPLYLYDSSQEESGKTREYDYTGNNCVCNFWLRPNRGHGISNAVAASLSAAYHPP